MPLSPTLVFRNGRVFRADGVHSFAEAIAVRGGQIVAVGADAEVAEFVRGAEEVVDLAGRLIVPGFVDAHAHPIQGGLELGRCELSTGQTVADYRATIAAYCAAHPDRAGTSEWIVGGGWSLPVFPGGRPSRELLDDVAGGRPVFLMNRDHHSAWASTAALERAGLSADTPDPADGRIERDDAGAPTGLLHEGAMALIETRLPPTTQAEFDEALRVAQKYLHSLGVVSWQDAMVFADGRPGPHSTYLRADEQGALTARVDGALWWDRAGSGTDVDEQVAALARIRDDVRVRAGRYGAETIKIMQDGVAETYTAGLLEPYLDRCGHATGNSGLSFLPPDLLNQVSAALDSAGFQLHFHALGDRAVREVLDALEFVRATNGSADRRHQLAHLQIVHPDDVARFRSVGAIANLQPLWACHEPQMDELTIPFIGPTRAGWQYPFGDLARAGATLAMGSDWPVSSPDPLLGLHTAVNRVSPEAPAGTPALGSGQQLVLADALTAYTAGSAFARHRDASLSVGNPADLVLLDRDPFAGPTAEIGTARVQRTYVAGRLVHHSD